MYIHLQIIFTFSTGQRAVICRVSPSSRCTLHVYIYMHLHTYIYANMYVYICIYIYTHTHTYTNNIHLFHRPESFKF